MNPEEFLNHIANAVGIAPLDFFTTIAVAWAIFDIWKFVPRWKDLDQSMKSNVRLVIIMACLGLVMSLTMHLRGQIK